jgi:hypothetical protein
MLPASQAGGQACRSRRGYGAPKPNKAKDAEHAHWHNPRVVVEQGHSRPAMNPPQQGIMQLNDGGCARVATPLAELKERQRPRLVNNPNGVSPLPRGEVRLV